MIGNKLKSGQIDISLLFKYQFFVCFACCTLPEIINNKYPFTYIIV